MIKIIQHIIIIATEFPPQPGGIGAHAYHLAYQLNNQDYQVTVLVDNRSNCGTEEMGFDADLPFKVIRTAVKKPRVLMYLSRLKNVFIIGKDADLIIASGKFSLWSVAFFSLFFKKRCMAILHGTEVNFKNYFLKRSINYALTCYDKLIAVSHYTKQLVSKLDLDITVIPNGYGEDKWYPITNRYKNLKGWPKLITVGNVTERKGQAQVIRCLPKLLKTYPEVHYHCVGLTTEMDSCIELAKHLGVFNHVTFHGRLKDEVLQSYMRASDIFVMLSTETASGDVEGFGIALIEANALGIPTIGSTGSGIEDAINNGKSGLLINGYDSLEFKKAIMSILNHQEHFIYEAKKWAEAHSWSRIISMYINTIKTWS
ncbi:glycosyltransferase family 4 protein [Winogradskyella undariae]|uniref:glycosyltransferase family 4 protein n=1 Tax=Winogradskyella undariae TaxID=1285465 RepID=UPI0027B9375B|nr:glycosyltransferase family 4 protein [Winogradskyella undariae]